MISVALTYFTLGLFAAALIAVPIKVMHTTLDVASISADLG